MKTARKVLLLVLCAALLVSATVMGTLAYLSDTTDEVTNTFTVGKVELGDGNLKKGLDEAKTNEKGEPLDKNDTVVDDVKDAVRVTTNNYVLQPGHHYTKDPTVHVRNDSETCYVFVKVENGIADFESTKDEYYDISEQISMNGWTALTGVDDVYYKTYSKQETPNASTYTDLAVFSSFKIDDNAQDIDGWDEVEDQVITITGYAVQVDGFDTALDAWNANFATATPEA